MHLSACILCTCACKSTGTIQMQDRKDGYNQASVGSWGSAPDPDGGACSTPPYLLAGQQGATSPAPSPGRGFLNFMQILHLAVCTLPYIHVLSWLRHCMVESTYNMLCTPPPPQHTTWLRAWARLVRASLVPRPTSQLRCGSGYETRSAHTSSKGTIVIADECSDDSESRRDVVGLPSLTHLLSII